MHAAETNTGAAVQLGLLAERPNLKLANGATQKALSLRAETAWWALDQRE